MARVHRMGVASRAQEARQEMDAEFLVSRRAGVPARAVAENESDSGGREVEAISLCVGQVDEGYAGGKLVVGAEGEEPGYAACATVSV